MTDTQSGSPEPKPATDDRQARFLKSLYTVFKNDRDTLSSLPEILEQCLAKEAQISNLTGPQNAEDHRNDDQKRLAVRKQKDMEKQMESLQEDLRMKTQRIATLEETLKDKTATIELMKSGQSTRMSTKDRNSVEKELKKRDELLEASEKQVKWLEEETLKLKNELEKKEKEKLETVKLQEEKLAKKEDQLQRMYDEYKKALQEHKSRNDSLIKELDVYTQRNSKEKELKKGDKQLEASEKRVKLLEEETLKLKNELEKKENEKLETAKLQEEELAKKDDQLQRMHDEYKKAVQEHKSRNNNLIKELDVQDEEIKEYTQSLSKMKDDLSNAHAQINQYKTRLASLSEKRVKQDQRFVEDTLGSNRPSELERDFSTFFDEDRMDACEKMQSIYHNKEETFIYIYYPRLACIIFETAYEQVKKRKKLCLTCSRN